MELEDGEYLKAKVTTVGYQQVLKVRNNYWI